MSGLAGFGTLFQMGDGASPETFTTVTDVTNIRISLNAEVSFDINFDLADPTHQNLRTLLTNQAVNNFRIVFPTSPATTWQFAGLVTSYEVNVPIDNKLISASITIKITGKPQFTVS